MIRTCHKCIPERFLPVLDQTHVVHSVNGGLEGLAVHKRVVDHEEEPLIHLHGMSKRL